MTLKEYFEALEAAVVAAKAELDRAAAALLEADAELQVMCEQPSKTVVHSMIMQPPEPPDDPVDQDD